MYLNDLESQVALGEDSRQFKRDVGHGDALAAEMAAFANSEGGVNYPSQAKQSPRRFVLLWYLVFGIWYLIFGI